MKILNLYAGIGGNRKLWGDNHNIVAVENNIDIAEAYSKMFPADKVVVIVDHEYLLVNYNNFDFIWSSPPCVTHSRARFGLGVCSKGYRYEYPDMRLYEEIILLQSVCKSKWCVENVFPYYEYLIEPRQKIGRHAYWANFPISPIKCSANSKIAGHTCKGTNEMEFHKKRLNINLDEFKIDKRKALRNCVEPEIGLHILNCARNITQDQFSLWEINK
jgi:DNA (cytosine-5)-methyltransferase 1